MPNRLESLLPKTWQRSRELLNKVQDAVTSPKAESIVEAATKALDIAVKIHQAGLTGPTAIAGTALQAVSTFQTFLHDEDRGSCPVVTFEQEIDNDDEWDAVPDEIIVLFGKFRILDRVTLHELHFNKSTGRSVKVMRDEGGNPSFAVFYKEQPPLVHPGPGGDQVKRSDEKFIEGAYFHASFDFATFTEIVWKVFGSKTVKVGTQGGSDFGIYPVPEDKGPYIGRHNVDTFHAELEKFQSRGVSRANMLFGFPGTGKTRFVRDYANKFDKTLLIIPPSYLQGMHNATVECLLELCRPAVLLLDDIHEAPAGIGYVMTMIEDVRRMYPQMLVITTCNPIPDHEKRKFAALFRPGRLGARRVFSAPSPKEKEELLVSYITQYGGNPRDFKIPRLVKLMRHPAFTHDYVRAVAEESIIYGQKDLEAYTTSLNDLVDELNDGGGLENQTPEVRSRAPRLNKSALEYLDVIRSMDPADFDVP